MLGAEADAHYGRLRLAPDLRSLTSGFAFRALRVGDALVDLDCRSEGGVHTFTLRQVGGRVPLNLILEPRLPSGPAYNVRISDEEAEVGIIETESETRLRLQFPLDPERSLHIVGRT